MFAVFFQIKCSILSSQGQIIFVSDPWLTSHRRKVWKSSKLRPLPNLSVVVLAYEAKRQHRSGNYYGCVSKNEVQINRNSTGGPIIETRQQSRRKKWETRRLRLVAPVPFSWTAVAGLSKPGSEVWVFTFVPAARQGDAQFDQGRIARLFTSRKCELSRQNKSSRTNLSPTERANSFIFEIMKLGGERAVSSLTNRRISLSNKFSSTS